MSLNSSPSEDLFLQQEEEDDDDVSITSTHQDDNDSEKEWEVDDVLAERPHPDISDARQYLIRWEGFELEYSTWEPIENLGEGLVTKWEENKIEIDAGTRTGFDLTMYDAACAGRMERHMRRNAKRQRLGLPQTLPLAPEYTDGVFVISPIEQESAGSDDEAEEVDHIDAGNIPSSKPTTTVGPLPGPSNAAAPRPVPTTKKATKQKTFVGIPLPAPTSSPSVSQRPEKSQDQRPPLSSARASVPAPVSAPSSRVPPGPIRRASGGTMTGYQGTARKSSLFRTGATKALTLPTSIAANKPLSTIKGPSALSSNASISKPKRLTATRTPQLPASVAPNVFAGGKQRRKRANLADVMDDPSKAPKAFYNMRIMNMAKKKGIEKGDAAGALSTIPSKFIIGNEQANTGPRRSGLISPITAAPSQNHGISDPKPAAPTPTTTSKDSAQPISTQRESTGEVPSMKRKKSVRFTGEDDDGLTSMIVEPEDDISGAGSSIKNTEVVKEAPVSKKVSLEAYHERGPPTPDIQKQVKFGSGTEVRVSFGRIARHTAPWLTAFKAEKVLHFASTCSSFHFSAQRLQLIGEKLAVGEIDPVLSMHAMALKNVAMSLQRGSMGLHLTTGEFSALVYPAGCDSWDWVDADTKKPNAGAVLRYLIFRSPSEFRDYYSFYKDPRAFNRLLSPDGAGDPEVLGALTGLDFKKLLPQDRRLEDKQAYMLLLPLKAKQLLGVVMTWLRTHQPDRPIFTVEEPNSWCLFHEAVQNDAGGTIIFHADFTLWKLEKIPNLWRMLESRRYTFWHLDTGEGKRPQYPSDLNAVSVPGTLQLTQLFPYGRAFFITPSFAISEPARLCAFLKWFKLYASNPGYIIVTCHDFPQFLKDVMEEKQEERVNLKRNTPGDKDALAYLDRHGRSERDIDDHSRAIQLLQEIREQFGDEETSEGIRKTHWLDELIDPNDEQSLVNAFCWWTQLKCDRYRRFYVLGSNSNKISRAYRHIVIPRYFDTEGNDPDIASILVQRQVFAAQLQKEADEKKTDPNMAWGTGGTVNRLSRVVGEWRNSVCEAPFPFPGTLFSTDSSKLLQRWIEDHRRRTGINWAELHKRPVAWKDWEMAVQFGDGDESRSQFDTFSGWFKSAPEFSRRRNTWYGLFYTITDTWDEYMPKRKYERHPWIAVYRPKNPHKISPNGAFNAIELFIWDITAGDRAKFGHGLLDMQCQLIDYVYENAADCYPRCSLSDVWYSSTSNLQISRNENPLDITCRRIEDMFTNGRAVLPPMDDLLRGHWTQIDSRLWSSGMSPMTRRRKPKGKPSGLVLERVPQNEKDQLKPERMIWHPVNGDTGGRGTKCFNHLHKACLGARLKDPGCDRIRYQYCPTQEWWADQVDEGRGYGYIWVGAAGRVIDKLPNL